MSERDQRLRELIKHVGCGDVDNFGQCEHCDAIREALAALAQREAEIARLKESERAVIECAHSWAGRAEAAEAKAEAREAEIAALRAEIRAMRSFGEQHEGGCQFLHGGGCSCGWNLIEARLEEAQGESPERVAWLRSTMKFAYDEDRQRTEDVLTELNAALRAEGPAPPPTR